MKTEDILKKNKFPDWFASHKIFKEVKEIKKVFPAIGLENSEKIVNLDGESSSYANQLLASIDRVINHRILGLEKYISSKPKMNKNRKLTAEKCLFLLRSCSNLLKNRDKFCSVVNGKVAIKLPSDIAYEDDRIFRESQSIFRVYNRLNEFLQEGKFSLLPKYEDLYEFKEFSSNNIPMNGYKIVFSSDGDIGAWDIATMSMRGIQSCQSWDGEYRYQTIGSAIDPFVGIIYLTSNAKTKYGSKMIRRSIVRFVVNRTTNKPYLLVDNMYPSSDQNIFNEFKSFLEEKTNNKFEVHYAPASQNLVKDSYIPLTKIREKLATPIEDNDDYDEDYPPETLQSYQDIKIVDGIPNRKDKQSILFDKNSRKKENRFIKVFNTAITSSIKDIDLNNVNESIKPTISRLKGKNGKNMSYAHYIPTIASSIASAFISDINKDDFTNSDAYIKRVYLNYFNNKSKVLDKIKLKLSREISGNLDLKKNKISPNEFISIMKLLLPDIDKAVKKSLISILQQEKSVKPLPLP